MNDIAQAVANLDAWLETMRCPGGYGGPVVHWWQNCLSYTGPGFDWRYEGIIIGYLTLWRRTGQEKWLEKACQAGDDLVKGQLPGGNFRCSSFEQNPYAGGTPHEAACDLALQRLALTLRELGDERWPRYAQTAELNLLDYFINRLWDEEAQSFRDQQDTPSLVPNKVCTLVEALFAWAELRGDEEPIERYALPVLETVVALQVKAPQRLAGAIPQNRLGEEVVDAYFPYYIARCIPALYLAHQHTDYQRWLDTAGSALGFVKRCLDMDGLLPQVIYSGGENRFPRWIAPLGDILRVARLMATDGVTFRGSATQASLLDVQLPTGAFATASGFAAQVSQKSPNGSLPEFRDALPVAGWNDKAFRYLATQVPMGEPLPEPVTGPVEIACQVRGKPATWTETGEEMRLRRDDGETLYLWSKGQPWAEMVAPEALWK